MRLLTCKCYQYSVCCNVLNCVDCMCQRSWSGKGLDCRVLSMLVKLVDTSLEPSKLKIYFTGMTRCRRDFQVHGLQCTPVLPMPHTQLPQAGKACC